MARTKRGRALGPLLEAPELCRAAPVELAALYDPLIVKSCLSLTPAVQFCGARVVFIPKAANGPWDKHSNRRAMWLANHVPEISPPP